MYLDLRTPASSVRLSDLTWRFYTQERAVGTCLRETEPRGSWKAVGLLFLFLFYFVFPLMSQRSEILFKTEKL